MVMKHGADYIYSVRCLVLFVSFWFTCVCGVAAQPGLLPPEITADAALLMDLEHNVIIYESHYLKNYF